MKSCSAIKLNKSETVKQFIKLAFAQYGSIAIAFLTNILITMYMSEEDYGSYRYVVNILIVVASLGNLGIYYSSARLLAKTNREDAARYYSTTTALILLISVLASCVLLTLSLIINDNSLFLRVAALFTYSVILQRTFIYMLKGSNRISDISMQTMLPQILILLSVLTIVFVANKQLSFNRITYIYGFSFAAVHVFTIVRLKAYRTAGMKATIKEIATDQRTNGFQIYVGSLVQVCLADVLNVIVAAVSVKAEYAAYALAVSMSTLMMQIPSIMATINFRRNAAINKIGQKDIATTLALILLSYAGLNLAVYFLFPVIYGAKYAIAPSYILILSLGYGLHGMGDYFNSFLNAHGCGKFMRNVSIATGIVQVGSAAIFIPLWEIAGLLVVRVVTSVAYFVLIYLSYRIYIKRIDACNS